MADETKSGNPFIKYIIIAILVLVLIIVVSVVSFMVSKNYTERDRTGQLKEAGKAIPVAVTFDMDEFLVSTSDKGMVKAKMQLGLSSIAMQETLRNKSAVIRDTISRVLADHTVTEINENFRSGILHERIKKELNQKMSVFFTKGGLFWPENEVKEVVEINFYDFFAK